MNNWMESPLCLVIADFCMEAFEQAALQASPYKPHMYKHYVDDTFLVWPHWKDMLDEFEDFLNGIHENIKLTVVELERKVVCLSWTF